MYNFKRLIFITLYEYSIKDNCIHNAGVGGSSPPVATINIKCLRPIDSFKKTPSFLRFTAAHI